ncbi:TetR/AcrR family transcriptional regulator [Pseudonocardiaceae bacterium YIM PH 21723]|nr:TetR/AcrR family transcriptional regulator [Pseudonocardiaceae bacterium YIM PH 21723]
MVSATPARTQRIRDRRDRLADVAAELFRTAGYHGVGVNDIAAAAGITGPALYRHFPSKLALLSHVVTAGVEEMDGLLTRCVQLDGPTAAEKLATINRELAQLAVAERGACSLWRWQGRHLPPEDRDAIRLRTRKLMTGWADLLRVARPELTQDQALLLCNAAMSIFGSVADHRATPPKRRFTALLATMADRVLAIPLSSELGDVRARNEHEHRQVRDTEGKKEQLLVAAMRLFREQGFRETSVEEIGQAVGLAPASVYRHFPSKADLLYAAGLRMADQLAADALAASGEPDPAVELDRLLRSFVDKVLLNRDLTTVYNTEVSHLPAHQRAELVRVQRLWVARMMTLLRSISELDEVDARVSVQAALSVVRDFIRTGRFSQRPALAAELVLLTRTILGLSD